MEAPTITQRLLIIVPWFGQKESVKKIKTEKKKLLIKMGVMYEFLKS